MILQILLFVVFYILMAHDKNAQTEETISGTLWVPPGQVETGQVNDVLFTRGVGACIEVGIYDTAHRIGHMAHIFSTYSSQQDMFNRIGTKLAHYSSSPDELEGWVTGGSSEASLPASIDTDMLLRSQALKALSSLGLRAGVNLSVGWNDDESLLLSASLDCSSGKHTTATSPVISS